MHYLLWIAALALHILKVAFLFFLAQTALIQDRPQTVSIQDLAHINCCQKGTLIISNFCGRNTTDRFQIDAASPQHHRTAASPHRSTPPRRCSITSVPHRRAAPRCGRTGGAALHRRAAHTPPPRRRTAATPQIICSIIEIVSSTRIKKNHISLCY
jgi:hypothetical protein